MEKGRTKGITANELKYIAILAMLIDHTAHLFIPIDTVLYQCMRGFGRITAPIMCFFISEGYHHTKNLKKYFIRMLIFTVLSHFPYVFCFHGSFFANSNESMIATLTLSLLSVHIVNTDKIERAYKLPIVLAIAFFADRCDWGSTAVIFTLTFEFARGDRKKQCISYAAALFFLKIINRMFLLFTNTDLFFDTVFVFGGFMAIPLLMLYNGEKGGGKNSKWFFYVFYPLHLLVLGYISFRYG